MILAVVVLSLLEVWTEEEVHFRIMKTPMTLDSLGSTSQRWGLIADPGYCCGPRTPIVLAPMSDDGGAEWTLVPLQDFELQDKTKITSRTLFAFIHVASGLAVDVSRGDHKEGTGLWLWPFDRDNVSQRWSLLFPVDPPDSDHADAFGHGEST